MKIGDYVRTDNGLITKIKMFYEQKWEEPKLTYARFLCEDYEIYEYPRQVKSSPNIIDLIEVGDVITTNNLCGEITKIDGDKIYTTCYDGEYCSASDIKTIVTHEQFKSIEYEVGE